jgi:hypothetical protein
VKIAYGISALGVGSLGGVEEDVSLSVVSSLKDEKSVAARKKRGYG